MLETATVDLTGRPLDPGDARSVAAALEGGSLVEVAFSSPGETAGLLEELVSIHTSRGIEVGPGRHYFSQILVTSEGAGFNWGLEGSEQRAEPLEVDAYPLLSRLVSSALALHRALRQPGEETLLSIVPSLGRTRSFPRFYHRDSHFSLDELAREGQQESAYRMVWDLGLERSSEILDVDFVPRRALLAEEGGIRPGLEPLFQQQPLDFRHLTEAEIDAVQQQMTEDLLPFPGGHQRLDPGRAFIWLDDLFFHTVYLRHGRSLEELWSRPRSIVLVREFCHNRFREIDWPPSVRALPTMAALLDGR